MIQFKTMREVNPSAYFLHFNVKPFIQSKEYELVVTVHDGKAVKINDGTCINADGWFDWDEVAEESELLELVNEVYKEEF